jgi:hypothetical protein
LITVNVALVGTQAINSFTHNRHSRCRRVRKILSRAGLLPSLESLQCGAAKQISRRTHVNWLTIMVKTDDHI